MTARNKLIWQHNMGATVLICHEKHKAYATVWRTKSGWVWASYGMSITSPPFKEKFDAMGSALSHVLANHPELKT